MTEILSNSATILCVVVIHLKEIKVHRLRYDCSRILSEFEDPVVTFSHLLEIGPSKTNRYNEKLKKKNTTELPILLKVMSPSHDMG